MKKKKSDFFATDVYPKWRQRVKEATESVIVFSPFFDSLLLRLLKVNTTLSPDNISVVTFFSADNLLELKGQLITVKKLIKTGIKVYQLDRLHAKVLLTDDKWVTVGSQNFTKNGTLNKETTVMPKESLENSVFIQTLKEWLQEAIPINEELVDSLLKGLQKNFKEQEALTKQSKIDQALIIGQYSKQKIAELIKKLKALEKDSNIQFKDGYAYGTVTTLWNENDCIDTLLADHNCDFTLWKRREVDGRYIPLKLERLSMFPMLMPETMQMGFIRVGRTRISYIRDALTWTNRELKLGQLELTVSIEFPRQHVKERNMVVTLDYKKLEKCTIDFLFNGTEAKLINSKFRKPRGQTSPRHIYFTSLIADFLGNPNELDEFLSSFFSTFRYKKLGINNPNVTSYFTRKYYRLSIVEFKGSPFLIIQPNEALN